MREGVEIIKRLWTEPIVSHNGTYYRVKEAVSNPKPVQKPHPPVWFGGRSRELMKAVAELGDGWLPAIMTPQTYRTRLDDMEDLAADAGRSLKEIEAGYFPVTNISLNAKEALETSKRCIAAGEIDQSASLSMETRLKWGVHGSPEMAVENIEEFVDAGVRHFVFHIIPQRNTIGCMRLLAEKVLPQFR